MNIRSGPFVAGFLLLLTSACSADGGTGGRQSQAEIPGSNLVSYEEVNAEYEKTMENLQLPDGAATAPGFPKPTEPTSYEKGAGVGAAEVFWICAWEKEWLDKQGTDQKAAEVALQQLRKAPDTQFMSKQLDEPGRRFFDEYLAKAALGDPSGFQNDVEQNCLP
ncbi:MAG: hypothetical protein ACRCTR_00455 [Actinomycetota bacterium]